jgi:hypothetical protein
MSNNSGIKFSIIMASNNQVNFVEQAIKILVNQFYLYRNLTFIHWILKLAENIKY